MPKEATVTHYTLSMGALCKSTRDQTAGLADSHVPHHERFIPIRVVWAPIAGVDGDFLGPSVIFTQERDLEGKGNDWIPSLFHLFAVHSDISYFISLFIFLP